MGHAWAGGLTAPQWSSIDFDGDGDEDLFAFDRDGDRILMFERMEIGPQVIHRERIDWEQGWPEGLEDWVLLRDADCDGRPDLFTVYQNAFNVYRNTGDFGEAEFTPWHIPLNAIWDFGSGEQELPTVAITIDKPAILDLDDDGDLDFLAFTETSNRIYAYTGQTPCDLDLVVTNRCYGMIDEAAESNLIYYGELHTCDFNVVDPRGLAPKPKPSEDNGGYRHAGGTLTAIQLDGENLPDLLLSDVTYPTIASIHLENAVDGQDSAAWVDMAFPSLSPHGGPLDTVHLPRFPAAYPVDIEGDGDQDLVFSPFTHYEVDDDACVHLWRNDGSAEEPLWVYATDNWIQSDMIDVGRGAYPHLVDFDGDGLLDIAIANKERYEGIGNTPSAVATFRNSGTATNPLFDWVSWDALPLDGYGIESAQPAFTDWDGDGDVDAVVGDEMGLLHRFENVAGPGNWPEWELHTLAMQDAEGATIDVGQFATPVVADVNNDGVLDLIVGEKNGNLNLLLGCGLDAGAPLLCVYESPETGTNWAGVFADNTLGINGYSVPFWFSDEEGNHLLVANEVGTIQYFGTVDSEAFDAILVEVDGAIGGFLHGVKASGALGDLDGDGLPELLMGMQNGGVRYHKGTPSGVAEWTEHTGPVASIAPNPSSSAAAARVVWAPVIGEIEDVSICDAHGRTVFRASPVQGESSLALPASLAPGLYLVRLVPDTKMGAPFRAPISLRWVVGDSD
jgi:hypothetical protein